MNIFNPITYDKAVIGAGNRVCCTSIKAFAVNINFSPAKYGKVSQIYRTFNLIQNRALADMVQLFTFNWFSTFTRTTRPSPLVSFNPFSFYLGNCRFNRISPCSRFSFLYKFSAISGSVRPDNGLRRKFFTFSDGDINYRLKAVASASLLNSKASFNLQFFGGNNNAFD